MAGVGGGSGWLLHLPWSMALGIDEADEITAGTVWGPGVVEAFSWRIGTPALYVRAWAMPGRLPTRQGLALGGVVNADSLLDSATDEALVHARGGMRASTTGALEIVLGRVVPWSVWSLVVRCDNEAGVTTITSGVFLVRVLDVEQVGVVAYGGRRVAPHLAHTIGMGVS